MKKMMFATVLTAVTITVLFMPFLLPDRITMIQRGTELIFKPVFNVWARIMMLSMASCTTVSLYKWYENLFDHLFFN